MIYNQLGFLYQYQRHGYIRLSRIQMLIMLAPKRFTSRYRTYVGNNLVIWKSKKQTIVARYTVELSIELWHIQSARWCGFNLVDRSWGPTDTSFAHALWQSSRNIHCKQSNVSWEDQTYWVWLSLCTWKCDEWTCVYSLHSFRGSDYRFIHQTIDGMSVRNTLCQVGHVWYICSSLRGSIRRFSHTLLTIILDIKSTNV